MRFLDKNSISIYADQSILEDLRQQLGLTLSSQYIESLHTDNDVLNIRSKSEAKALKLFNELLRLTYSEDSESTNDRTYKMTG